MSVIPFEQIQNLNQSSRKGDKRKYEIIMAAIDCIAEEGIEATTFDMIAKKVGIRVSNVVYHFPDKREIIRSAIKWISFQSRIRIHKSLEKNNCLKTYIHAYSEWVYQFPNHAAVVFLFFYYCSFNPTYRELYELIRKEEKQRLSEVLYNEFKDDLSHKSCHWIAETAHQLMTGAILDAVSSSPQVTQKRLKQKLKHAIEVLVVCGRENAK